MQACLPVYNPEDELSYLGSVMYVCHVSLCMSEHRCVCLLAAAAAAAVTSRR
jgi:hypothetical protein